MFSSIPASLISAVSKVIYNEPEYPAVYASFRHMFDDVDQNAVNEDSQSSPHIDSWLAAPSENNRRALNSLNLDQEHTDDDKTHVYRYTAASKPLNKMLFASHADNKKAPDNFEVKGNFNFTHDIKGLDAAVSRNRLQHKLVSYCGINWNPAEKSKHSQGMLNLPAYTSTSTDKGTALRFARNNNKGGKDLHVLRIEHPEGSRGLYTHDDPTITHYEQENEYIAPRNMLLKVHPTPESFKTDDGDHVHVWTAHRKHEEEPHYDLDHATEDGQKVLYSHSGLKVARTDSLSALKKHYPAFYHQDEGAQFHANHIFHPIYTVHTPEGKIYQTRHEYDETRMVSPDGRINSSVTDVAKKYPQISHLVPLFTRK